MNLNLRKLNVHKEWLFKMRYDEKFINPKERSGSFVERLRRAFEQTLIENVWTEKPVEIPLTMEGIFYDEHGARAGKRRTFDSKGDTVHFNFSYSYNPENGAVDLQKLTAILNDHKIEYPIERNARWQLPDPDKAYQDLLTLSRRQLLERIKEARLERTEIGKPRPSR